MSFVFLGWLFPDFLFTGAWIRLWRLILVQITDIAQENLWSEKAKVTTALGLCTMCVCPPVKNWTIKRPIWVSVGFRNQGGMGKINWSSRQMLISC